MELLIYLLKSTTVVSLFYLVYFIFLRKETFLVFNRIFLNSGLICALVIPFYKYKIFEESKSNGVLGEQDISQVYTGVKSYIIENHFNIENIFITFYLFVSTIFILRLIINIFSFFYVIKNLEKKKAGAYILVENDKIKSPFSFLNYIVYNPKIYSNSELNNILNHEKEHVKQKHSYDLLFMELFLASQWFNPLVWMYKKSLIQNIEFLADSKAVTKSTSTNDYIKTMLKMHLPEKNNSLVNNFFDSAIKNRIAQLTSNKSQNLNIMKSLFIIPALLLFIFQFNTQVVAQNFSSTHGNNHFYLSSQLSGNNLPDAINKILKNTEGYSENDTPLFLLDKELVGPDIAQFEIHQISSILVLNKENAAETYGSNGKLGVVLITTKNPLPEFKNPNLKLGYPPPHEVLQPIVMVDGQEISAIEYSYVAQNSRIKSRIFLEGEEAIKKYGEKGRNGVIEVVLK